METQPIGQLLDRYKTYSEENLATARRFKEALETGCVTPEMVEELFRLVGRLDEMISANLDGDMVLTSRKIRQDVFSTIAESLNSTFVINAFLEAIYS